MIIKDIYGFRCFGNLGDEETTMNTDIIHLTYMPIRKYLRSPGTLELFCEFGNNTKFPIFKCLKSIDWSGEDQHVDSLVQGCNKTQAPNFSGNTSKIMFAMYHETLSGFSRVGRNDAYGNTKLYYSNEDVPCTQANFKKINWTQINRDDDTSVLTTSGTSEKFCFFGKEYTAKCIKYESIATVFGDSYCGLCEFSLLNGFSYSVTPGKKYEKPRHPFPDYYNVIDLDKFFPHQPNETDELYAHYPDICDQPCFAQFGSTKTHRKSKVFDRDVALYSVDPFE